MPLPRLAGAVLAMVAAVSSLPPATLTAQVSGSAPAAAPAAITPVPAFAARRAASIQVRIAPDRAGWTYAVGEPVQFTVQVTADQQPLTGLTVSYEVGPELFPTATRTAVLPAGGLVIDGGTLREPGFIRCAVTAQVDGRTYRGVATAGFSPEELRPLTAEPADFDAFWAAGRAELDRIPLEAQLTPLPEASTADLDVYHVSVRTIGAPWAPAPARVYGILCEPKAPGRYPAILRVPGAGVRPYPGDKDLARRGAITLEIGVHGIPVNLPAHVYDQLYAGALDGYWLFNLDDRERYYYRRIILSCLRACDFLTSRPSWDGKNLLVVGASQGGQLAIATAALDPRITGLTAIHPAACDLAAELQGRAGGWPHPFMPARDGTPSPHATPAKLATAAYYDTANFARRVRAPGHYIWGYNDEVCPPTSVHAAFNVISAPKELTLMLEQAHTYPPEQHDALVGWLARTLGWPGPGQL